MSGKDDDDDIPINPFSKYQRHTLLGVAKLLAVSRSTVERLRDNGKIKGWHQYGRRWYTDGASVKEYLDNEGGEPEAAE
jgi:excisionase family DNA binding protein